MDLTFVKELWELAKNAGPFGTALLLYLYLRLDKKHETTLAQLSAVALAQTKAATALEATLRGRTKAMESLEDALRAVVNISNKNRNKSGGAK